MVADALISTDVNHPGWRVIPPYYWKLCRPCPWMFSMIRDD